MRIALVRAQTRSLVFVGDAIGQTDADQRCSDGFTSRRCRSAARSRARAAAQAFLGSYFAEVPRDWLSRFPVNYACAALKSARIVLQRLEADWHDRIADLLVSVRAGIER